MSPVTGEDEDPKRPANEGEQGVDVNEATLSEDDTLQGEEALAETRKRHEEMAEEDEAERS